MEHSWESLTFVHWRYDSASVERLLPGGLELDTFDGSAWVSLSPFVLTLWPPRVPALRISCPEANLRTYVVGPKGAEIWFLSLDVANPVVVFGGRYVYGVPYFWSHMKVERRSDRVVYESNRRWPRLPGAALSMEVEVARTRTAAELNELDHWLTARWRLYGRLRGFTTTARVEHPPWPLQSARLVRLDQRLTEPAGLPAPDEPALVHYSPGVNVRLGAPALVRTPSR
jgi:uncharacterized protein YqjF (DUF2071 family)